MLISFLRFVVIFLLLSASSISFAQSVESARQSDEDITASGRCLVFHDEDGKYLVCEGLEEAPASEQTDATECQDGSGEDCDVAHGKGGST